MADDNSSVASSGALPSVTTEFEAYDLDDYWQYRLSEALGRYGPAVVFFVGTTFNLLSLCVLLRPCMRTRSTFAYLTAITVADIIFLTTNTLESFVRQVTDAKAMEEHDWVCIVTNFVAYSSSHFSVWVLVMVTSERLLVVILPFKAHLWCQRSRAYAAMALLLLLVVALNLHELWTFGLDRRPDNGTSCRSPEPYKFFGEEIWPWIDTCIYSLLPSAIMLTMNIVIIAVAYAAEKKRRNISFGIRDNNEHRKLTIMLLTLSFSFILMTTPISALQIYISLVDVVSITDQELVNLLLTQQLFWLLMYINHAINFFLYCLTGKRFRSEFVVMVRSVGCRCKKARQDLQTVSTVYAVSETSHNEVTVSSLPHKVQKMTGHVQLPRKIQKVTGYRGQRSSPRTQRKESNDLHSSGKPETNGQKIKKKGLFIVTGSGDYSKTYHEMRVKNRSRLRDNVFDPNDAVLLGYKSKKL